MRTLGPFSAALAQSSWSLLLMALVIGPFLGRIASNYVVLGSFMLTNGIYSTRSAYWWLTKVKSHIANLRGRGLVLGLFQSQKL